MPGDDTRRLLKTFGVAVTAYEDAVGNNASIEEIRASEAEVRARLAEVTSLIEHLRDKAATTRNPPTV
jgi:hypothetical protein